MDESPFNMFLNLPDWLIAFLLPVSLAAFFQLRSGSSYGLLNRLYALVIGGSEFNDTKLKSFWEERTDVERFNALFHMQAKSLKEIHCFQQRIIRNELDIKLFTQMRGGFDSQRRKVKKCALSFFTFQPQHLDYS